jgi:predicted ATPase
MRLISVRVINYKSFRDSGDVPLDTGFNVIVGRNDAGKTSFLEAISLGRTPYPHRSRISQPHRKSPVDYVSRVVVTFSLSREEIYDAAVMARGISVPLGDIQPSDDDARASAEAFLHTLKSEENLIQLLCHTDGHTEAIVNGFQSPAQSSWYQVIFPFDGHFSRETRLDGDIHKSYPYVLADYLRSRIYSFRAERVKAGQSVFAPSKTLNSDISNLPEVLIALQGNPPRLARLNEYIRFIFPHVDHVSVLPQPTNNEIRILVWPLGIEDREDLAIPLTDSGTGIGQVLAMLYVVLTANQAQIILIDEPQSFLHPGAVRKLIEILKAHKQHQFIVSTHSTETISAAEPKRILSIRKIGSESHVDSIDATEQRSIALLLDDLGVRLSDVFGADRILWVEGRTEELCFPLILRHRSPISLSGTAIRAVQSTGDFDRHESLAIEVYRRLSHGVGLLPPAIGFVFDAESRTEAAMKRFKKESGDLVEFLPRRMYECYLLEPTAISVVLSGLAEKEISTGRIEAWQDSAKVRPKYYPKGTPLRVAGDSNWMHKVHAADFLSDMFRELSEGTVEFSKTRDSVLLTEQLLESNPNALAEVKNLLDDILRRNQRT